MRESLIVSTIWALVEHQTYWIACAVKDHVVVERVNVQAFPFTHNRDQSERKETTGGHLEDSESSSESSSSFLGPPSPRFLELSFEKEKGSRRFVSTGYKRNKHNRTCKMNTQTSKEVSDSTCVLLPSVITANVYGKSHHHCVRIYFSQR